MSEKFGAVMQSDGKTKFTFWAPDATAVSVETEEGRRYAMQRRADGVFEATVEIWAGAKYKYRISEDLAVPDPASRAQDGGVHGWSVVVDPAYDWRHSSWRGRPWQETVVYELHPGALGGFAGIEAQLERLASLGVTAIELMPIGEFPGRHNWGYDGVLIYAPAGAYGTPTELRRMIDSAHGFGIQVFLDVVYNHFGPDGNYLNAYAKAFFHQDRHTPWGNAIDFSQPHVQDFFIGNALYWLNEYRFDGLRLDAVHAIEDEDFLLQMAAAIRDGGPERAVHLVLENEHNDSRPLRTGPAEPKYDAQWADDWHHGVHVLLTGESEGYYEDFHDAAGLLARCLAEGFAYQGEPSAHAGGQARGTPSAGLPSTAFVICLQNHDQVGNRAMGERLTVLADKDALRAAVVLLLMTPQIPLIFFGEEFGTATPFLFFTDHNAELGKLVTQGRRKEFAKFAAFTDPATREKIPDPNDPATFAASVPVRPADADDWETFYTRLLMLRREHVVPGILGCQSMGAKTLGKSAVRAAWRMNGGGILTIAANFGAAAVACEAGPGEILVGENLADGGILKGRTAVVWQEK